MTKRHANNIDCLHFGKLSNTGGRTQDRATPNVMSYKVMSKSDPNYNATSDIYVQWRLCAQRSVSVGRVLWRVAKGLVCAPPHTHTTPGRVSAKTRQKGE